MSSPSPAVSAVVRSLRDDIRQHYRAGHVLVAVDGLADTSVFADALASAFTDDGVTACRASVDDSLGDEGLRALVSRFRDGNGPGGAAAPGVTCHGRSGDDAVLVVDGRFLHRAPVRGLWHWSVWLDAPLAPVSEDSDEPRAAQVRYLRENDPKHTASAIVDVTDPARPVQVFGDFC